MSVVGLMLKRRGMGAYKRPEYLRFTAMEDGCTVAPTYKGVLYTFPHLEYSVNMGAWHPADPSTSVSLDDGDCVEWRCPVGYSNVRNDINRFAQNLGISFSTSGVIVSTGCPTTLLVATGEVTQIYHSQLQGVFVAQTGLRYEISLPEGLVALYGQSFGGNTGIVDITIPRTATVFSEVAGWQTSGVFNGCTSIQSVHFSGDLYEWGNIDFGNRECSPLYYGHNLYLGNALVESATIGSWTKKFAFAGATCITEARFDAGITEIPEGLFQGCSNLARAVLPDTVQRIGNGAFSGCSSLSDTSVPKSVVEIGSYAFYLCKKLPFPRLPNTLASIGQYAFSGIGYKSGGLVLPDSLTTLGANCFSDFCTFGSCTLTLGNGVSDLPNVFGRRFTGTLTIPSVVSSIASGFMSANQISRVYIPSSVNSIGSNAFEAYGITDIRIALLSTAVPANDFSFLVYNANYRLYVPYSADHSVLAAYQAAWSNVAASIFELNQDGTIPA